MKPSTEAVLDLLRNRGRYGATDRDCLLYAHSSRAAARVWELRREGHEITTTLEVKRGVRYARYVLHDSPQGAGTEASPRSPQSRPLRGAVTPQAQQGR